MTATLIPVAEVVGVAWVATVDGVTPEQVSTTLPRDAATWAPSGYIQVSSVGGSPDKDFPMRRPVLQLDFWAVNPDSGKPPWGKANQLAELVRWGTYDQRYVRTVELPGLYLPARVMSAYLLDEPRRVPDDDASYARYTANLQLHYTCDGQT